MKHGNKLTFSFHNTFLSGNYARRKSFGRSAVFVNQLLQILLCRSLRETSGLVFLQLRTVKKRVDKCLNRNLNHLRSVT